MQDRCEKVNDYIKECPINPKIIILLDGIADKYFQMNFRSRIRTRNQLFNKVLQFNRVPDSSIDEEVHLTIAKTLIDTV